MRSSSSSPLPIEPPLTIYPIRSHDGLGHLTNLWKWWSAPSILLCTRTLLTSNTNVNWSSKSSRDFLKVIESNPPWPLEIWPVHAQRRDAERSAAVPGDAGSPGPSHRGRGQRRARRRRPVPQLPGWTAMAPGLHGGHTAQWPDPLPGRGPHLGTLGWMCAVNYYLNLGWNICTVLWLESLVVDRADLITK